MHQRVPARLGEIFEVMRRVGGEAIADGEQPHRFGLAREGRGPNEQGDEQNGRFHASVNQWQPQPSPQPLEKISSSEGT